MKGYFHISPCQNATTINMIVVIVFPTAFNQ